MASGNLPQMSKKVHQQKILKKFKLLPVMYFKKSFWDTTSLEKEIGLYS